jgi:hypothetical protein
MVGRATDPIQIRFSASMFHPKIADVQIGPTGAFIVLLLWVYCSVQIFLLGAKSRLRRSVMRREYDHAPV